MRRVGRGVYTTPDAAENPHERALARILGLHARLRAEHWFSHGSAAVLHGLPTWHPPDATHLYQHSAPSGRRDPLVIRHAPPPPDEDLGAVSGLPATMLNATVWDCLRSLRAVDGLVLADAAVRAGTDVGDLGGRLADAHGCRGVARARELLTLVDPGSESPGESACRFVLLRDGLPAPQTQVAIATHAGTSWVDLGWPQWRIAVEYDGRGKYAGREAAVFAAEKRRHDAIVEAGWRLIRATSEDLRKRGVLAGRVLAAIPSADRPRLTPRRGLG